MKNECSSFDRHNDRDCCWSEPHQPSERCGEDRNNSHLRQFSCKPDWSPDHHLRYCDNSWSRRLDGLQGLVKLIEVEGN